MSKEVEDIEELTEIEKEVHNLLFSEGTQWAFREMEIYKNPDSPSGWSYRPAFIRLEDNEE